MSRRPSVCFFSPVPDRGLLVTTEFYARDLAILADLGFDVRVATRWREIPRGCDLYFVWWWTWSFLPLLRAKLGGRPALLTGVVDYEQFAARPWWERALMRGNARAADWNALGSAVEHRWFASAMSPRASYIPLAVDTDAYAPGGGPRGPYVFTVCHMIRPSVHRKCMLELVRAVPIVRRECPWLRFVIAGDLMDGGAGVRDEARRLGVGDAVEFLGRVDPAEKVRHMRSCRVYAQPTRYEGFGVAIAEALSCGAPLVTSPVAAVPDVAGDCAEYVDGADPQSIADGILRLERDPALRERLSSAGRDRVVREFSVARRRDGLAAVIDALLAGGRLPAAAPTAPANM